MKQRNLGVIATAVVLLLLTGCAKEVPSGPRNLLPDLEARSRYGFSVEEATSALESVRKTVGVALDNGIAFKDLSFDNLNDLSADVAVVEGSLAVSELGGAATVVGVTNDGKHVFTAAYGDSGYCFYMRITNATPLKIERGAGFSVDCSADVPSDKITWSATDTFPDVTEINMPTSSVTKSSGGPAGTASPVATPPAGQPVTK